MIIQQRCPICNGNGIVPGGFYYTISGCGGQPSSTTEQCRNCNGQGVVYVEQDLQPLAYGPVDKESRLSPEDIEEIIDQVYDCDHNGQSFISFVSNWKQVATAIHNKIYGEGDSHA